jgi:two-component system, OmpR family, response regulator
MQALIVDDSEIFVYFARAALEAAGFSVRVAGTVAAGTDAALACSPDVACIDGHLPDGDGRDLCRELRRQSNRCAVVLVSAAPDVESWAGTAEVDVVLEKPSDPEVLLGAVRTALAARQR